MSTTLTQSTHTAIQEMGFGGFLRLAAKILDKIFLSCLLDMFDP
jgi:hypothetical protein